MREEKKEAAKKKRPGQQRTPPNTPPERSGEVKGPMGVGGKTGPDSGAKIKKPSKINQAAKGRFEEKEGIPAGENKASAEKLQSPKHPEKIGSPEQKKALPENTSHREEHLIPIAEENSTETSSKTKREKMHPKDSTPIILGESDPASEKPKKRKRVLVSKKRATVEPKEMPTEKIDAEKAKERIAERKKKTSEEKNLGSPAKKMARRKPVEGISAEEKSKLPNTSPAEDLKENTVGTAKELIKEILPDKETQDELKEMAKSVLPDQKELREKANRFSKDIKNDPDSISRAAKEMLPDEETVKKAKEMMKDFSGKNQEKREGT